MFQPEEDLRRDAMSYVLDSDGEAAAAKQREVNAAWRRHQVLTKSGERTRVPNSARRAADSFKERLGDSRNIRTAYSSPAFRMVLDDWCRKRGVGRARAYAKVRSMLAPASVEVRDDALLIVWLEARGPILMVDDPRVQQNCVLVTAAVIGRRGRTLAEASFPAVECPDHALARLFERAPTVDACAALTLATRAFLASPAAAFEEARTTGATLCLPAGPGLLLCDPLLVEDLDGLTRLLARARTFISADMVEPHQVPVLPAASANESVMAAALEMSP
jgi:hypothetical protein